MISQRTVLEIKNDERSYQFVCHPDSPLGEVYATLEKMKDHVFKLIAANQQKQEEASDGCVEQSA